MNILHVVSSIDISGGGLSKSVSDLALNQAIQGQKVTILTNVSKNPYLKESLHPNLKLVFVKEKQFKMVLNRLVVNEKFDLLHGHGIWQMPVHEMAQIAKRTGIPYVIAPHGMLEPWPLNAGKWKKKLALALYQRNDLARANCIRATAQMEAENIRKLGFKNPIAVIPNGIDIRDFPLPEKKQKQQKLTILFLSRIHPKKGIELLIEAWQILDKSLRQSWQVEIAGNGDESYINSLQQLINKSELTEEIKIIGSQFGTDKLKTYQQADLFVLPTYSENFGIVVAEAMACGIPVITTKGTPWEELNTFNAGWWIDIGVEPLAEALKQAMQLTNIQRGLMGQSGRKLVEANYSVESVGNKMSELYEWILNKREKPEFIQLF